MYKEEQAVPILLQVAEYLRLIANGYTPTPSRDEARELLDKIGALLESHDKA